MKNTALYLIFTLIFLSCGNAKGSDVSVAPAAVDTAEKQEEAGDTPTQADKWEGVYYTRKELNEKFDPYGLDPLGTYFWDEFGFLKDVYNLSAQESEMLGRWGSFDVDFDFVNNYYCFYPNKLFIAFFQSFDYCFYNERDMYLDTGFGTWEIENTKVIAQIYAFAARKHQTEIVEIITVKPYKIEIIDIDYIDHEGYSKRPFNRFKLPVELQEQLRVSDNVKNEYLMARMIYSIDPQAVGANNKFYRFFRKVPDMAQEEVNGLDIVQSPELIKKYILNFWP
jgi:hypothetical protein